MIVTPRKEVLLLIDIVPNICTAFLSLDPVEVRNVTYCPTCGELLGAPAVHTQDIITQKETFRIYPDTIHSRYVIQRLMTVKDNKHRSLELSTFSQKTKEMRKRICQGINLLFIGE